MESTRERNLIAIRLGFLIAKLDLTEGYSLEYNNNTGKYVDTVTRENLITSAYDHVNALGDYWILTTESK